MLSLVQVIVIYIYTILAFNFFRDQWTQVMTHAAMTRSRACVRQPARIAFMPPL